MKIEGSTASKQLLGKVYKCLENILRNSPLFIECKLTNSYTAVTQSDFNKQLAWYVFSEDL